MLDGAKILITGPTGQVAEPVATALAADNEVWGIARFQDATARERLEGAGVKCVPVDLFDPDLSAVPADVDYVLNFAVTKSFGAGAFDRDLTANVEALGLLLHHCRGAKAVLHCSSTAVYEAVGYHQFSEDDALGDNHRALFPTYSISKIAAEAMARHAARQHDLPTTIARLNVPYGDNGGWPAFHLEMLLGGHAIPVPDGDPGIYNPIHEDDIVGQIPRLLEIASVPATVVNWAGDDEVSIEEWCRHLGTLVGMEPSFQADPNALLSVAVDNTRRLELVGKASVSWQDGLRRMVAARHPERLQA